MQFIRKYHRSLATLLGLVALVAFMAIKVPDMHKAYITRSVGKHVVSLLNPANRGNGGTGFIMNTPSGSTVVITNAHVCRLAVNGNLDALMPYSNRIVSLKVLEMSDTVDLCAVEAPQALDGLELANSLSLYQTVGVVGHPKLEPLQLSLGQVVTLNETIPVIIESQTTEEACIKLKGKFYNLMDILTLCVKDMPAARTNVVIYGGNSGSPVVNIYGNVVGVLFAGDSDTNWGFIVPLKPLREFLEIY